MPSQLMARRLSMHACSVVGPHANELGPHANGFGPHANGEHSNANVIGWRDVNHKFGGAMQLGYNSR